MKRYIVLVSLVAILLPISYAIKRQPVRARPAALITQPGSSNCPRGCVFDLSCPCCECSRKGK